MAKLNKDLESYLKQYKDSEDSINTINRLVRQSYDKSQAKLNDGTYDRLDKLVEEAERTKFKENMYSELIKPLKSSIDSSPENKIFAEALVMNGFYGFTKEKLNLFIDQQKEDISFDIYMKFLTEFTDFNKTLNIRKRATLNSLDKVPANDVFNYVKVKSKDVNKSTLEERAELINQYKTFGAVPLKFLKEKKYI